MAVNPYDRYKKQSVMTMTQGEMVVRLFEETVKQLNYACAYIDQNNVIKSNEALKKAQRIVNHLRTTLNFECEISNNLDALYAFFISKIVDANIKKDKNELVEIIPMLSDLGESFSQAEKSTRMGSNHAISADTGARVLAL